MKAFIFDTETTGLVKNRKIPLAKQPEIIEFYGELVDLRSGEVLSETEFLIRPKTPKIDAIITKITGLTLADLKGKPTFINVADQICAALENCDACIAHNFTFDRNMISIEFERIGRTVKLRRGICTVEQTMHYKGRRLKMSQLYEHLFDEQFAGAHRARNDVKALTRICLELFKRGDIRDNKKEEAA